MSGPASMRVAMLGQVPLDETRIIGGVEAVMTLLLYSLAKFSDLDVHVVTCQPEQAQRCTHTTSGWPLHVLKRKSLGRITFHFRDIRRIDQTLQRIAPDLVHAQGMGLYAGAAVRSGRPHVVTVHGIFSREAMFAKRLPSRIRGFLDSAIERHWVSRVANVISISPYVEAELQRVGGFHGQIHRIENPVADEFFDLDAQSETGTVLYAGRVIPRKDLLTLLHALPQVREHVEDVRVRIAGETESAPEYVDACRAFVTRHSLDSVVSFLGSLCTTEMVQEYHNCTVLALPSQQETAPMAVAEAMASGRAVVATKVCGVPYMVEDGQSGVLVEAGDSEGMAQALIGVLSDSELRGRMGRRGREIAERRFRADEVARRTRAAYMRIAGTGRVQAGISEHP